MSARTCRISTLALAPLAVLALAACQTIDRNVEEDTQREAGYGAAAGAIAGALLGESDADDILAGAAVGAGIGAGVSKYMDEQEQELADLPHTKIERFGDETMRVRFTDDVLFGPEGATLDAEARRLLDRVAAVLAGRDQTAIVVQAHTDTTAGKRASEILSQRRAEAIRDYLVRKGVDGKRIVARGYGDAHPIGTLPSENRRVALLVKGKS
jgi:outer membrane protein OmpA-like peptidoglycan-associated protein